jgi:hypothetical protein
MLHRDVDLDAVTESKQQKMDMRFETWNVKELYRAGTAKISVRALAGYKEDLVFNYLYHNL